MTDFLDKTYKENETLNSSSGGYMKLVKGDNKFRIMSSPITGWEFWVDTADGKRLPKRVKINEKLDISKLEDPASVKRFWAFVVWNYDLKRLQILELTQKGLQQTLRTYAEDEDWGSPVDKYDIVINKTGDGMETKYSLIAKPTTKTEETISSAFKTSDIDLNALYEGSDPWKVDITQTDMDKFDESLEDNTK